MRGLYSPKRKFVFGTPDTEILQKLADLSGQGKLSISIGRTAHFSDAIDLIRDLEAGRWTKGKSIILMG